MQIKNLYGLDPYAKLEQSERNNQVRAERERRSATDTVRSDGDHSTVSDEARLYAEAFSTAMSAPGTRADKVAAIKAQISSGEYKIDTKQIALRLLSEDGDLLGL